MILEFLTNKKILFLKLFLEQKPVYKQIEIAGWIQDSVIPT